MIIFHCIPNQYGVVKEWICVDLGDMPDTMNTHNEIGLCFIEQLEN